MMLWAAFFIGSILSSGLTGDPCRVIVGDTEPIATLASKTIQASMTQTGDSLLSVSDRGNGVTAKIGLGFLSFSFESRTVSAEFSGNGRYLFRKTENKLGERGAELHDLPNQKLIRRVPFWGRANHVEFSPKGSFVSAIGCYDNNQDWVQGFSTTTGAETYVFHYHCGLAAPALSPDDQAVAYRTLADSIRIVRLGFAKAEPSKTYAIAGAKYLQYSPDGKQLAVATELNTAIITLASNTSYTLGGGQSSANRLVFSPDSKSLARLNSDGTISIMDLLARTERASVRVADFDGLSYRGVFSKDASHFLVFSPQNANTTYLFDSKTGEEKGSIAFAHPVWDAAFFSASSQDYISIRVVTVSDQKVYWTAVTAGDLCQKPVFESVKTTQTIIPKVAPAPPPILSGPALDEALARLCQSPFDEASWNVLNAEPQSALRVLSLKWQKPGAINYKTDTALLKRVLEFDSRTRHAILGSTLAYSPALYDQLVDETPHWRERAEGASSGCRTPSEEREVRWGVIGYFKTLTQSPSRRGHFETWARLTPFKEILISEFSFQNRQAEEHDVVATFLADEAMSGTLKVLGPGTLYRLAKDSLAALFHDRNAEHTNLVPIRDGYSLRLFIVGTKEIDHDPLTRTQYGFFVKEISSVRLLLSKRESHGPIKITWTHGTNSFTATLRLSTMPLAYAHKSQEYFPYSSMWNDERLVGIALAGTNMKGFQLKTMDQFKNYYVARGFVFENTMPPLTDVKAFIQEKVITGEADYLIKEAHNRGGDSMVAMRLTPRVTVLKGTRSLEDGKFEVIYLLVPEPEPRWQSTVISLNEFSGWLDLRQRHGVGPLVYVDAGCWSDRNIQDLVAINGFDKVWPVTSTTVVRSFENSPLNTERLWLDAFRSGQSMADINAAMKQNKEYLNGTKDLIINPGDLLYQQRIVDPLRRLPIAFDFTIQNEKGETYDTD